MKNYSLAPESIAAIVEEVECFCTEKHVDHKDALRLQLTLEEALLNYVDAFGTEPVVEVATSSFGRMNRVRVCIHCESLNPFSTADDAGIMRSLMATSEQKAPQWKYQSGANYLTFSLQLKRRLNSLTKIAIGLGLGILLGFAGRMESSAEVSSVLVSDYIRPLADAYTGLLGVMAILMVFFTFPLGIMQLENTAAFHSLTRLILMTYLSVTLIGVLPSAFFCIPNIQFGWTGSGVPDALKSGLDVLLNFMPNNLLTPFINFNCMQVLLIGCMFGFSFLVMGDSSRPLISAFDKCNMVAVLTNNYIVRVIYIYVGMITFSTVVQTDGVMVRQLMAMAPPVLIVAIVLPVLLAVVVSVRLKVALGVVFKRFLPSFLVNLSSANVGAAFVPMFNEIVDCGVDISYCTISCNLGTVLFKPLYSVFMSVMAMRMVAMSGTSVTPIWVVLTLFLAIMLSMAIPNIPGGATPVIVLLFGQLGFASSNCDIIVSLNAVMQFLLVPVNVFCLQCVTLLLANKEGKIDLEKLRNPGW